MIGQHQYSKDDIDNTNKTGIQEHGKKKSQYQYSYFRSNYVAFVIDTFE